MSNNKGVEEVVERLRRHIVGRIHVGLLKGGNALPSIRRLSRDTDTDHRLVAQAYRVLEEEGLVKIRPGAGVYVSARTGARELLEDERSRWLVEVLAAGWERRLGVPATGEVIRAAATTPVRCVCVESTRDHMVALAAELEADFGFDVRELGAESEGSPRESEEADVVVGTVFSAERVRELAASLGAPAVVVPVNAELARRVDEILKRSPVTAVVADPAYVRRMREYFAGTTHAGRVRAVLASELSSLDEVRPEEDGLVLATRAARRMLGAADYHLIPAPPSFISPASARQLVRVRVEVASRRGLLRL